MKIKLNVQKVSEGGGGTSDYNNLNNKPSINEETLSGNKTSLQLGLQDTLVSGQNIKTINNQSILGSGNITIQDGGSEVYPTVSGSILEFSQGSNVRVENEEVIF